MRSDGSGAPTVADTLTERGKWPAKHFKAILDGAQPNKHEGSEAPPARNVGAGPYMSQRTPRCGGFRRLCRSDPPSCYSAETLAAVRRTPELHRSDQRSHPLPILEARDKADARDHEGGTRQPPQVRRMR